MVSANFDELNFLPDWLPRWHVTWLRVQPRCLRFGGRQSTVRRVAKKMVFPVSRALGGTCQSWSRFAVLLQDLTPLHVNITRSTNLLSESCWVFVGGNSNYRRIYTLMYKLRVTANISERLLWFPRILMSLISYLIGCHAGTWHDWEFNLDACGLVDVNQPLDVLPRKWSFPFLEHSEEHARVEAVLQFCYRIWHLFMSTLRGVRICWVNLVECLSEETQIIDVFTHSKLQPHKLSQYTLETRLSFWYCR